MGAKQLKLSSKKAIVNVHSECLKQIEMNREVNPQVVTADVVVENKNGAGGVIYDEASERLPTEELEKMIRGQDMQKRMFFG